MINKASLGPAAASIGPAAGGVGCGHSFGSHSLGVGKREGRRGGDGESLKILQEGVDKIGDPQKYEADGMAKATHSPAVAHDQQEVMIPWTCPSRAACFATPMFAAIRCVCTLRHAFVPIRV